MNVTNEVFRINKEDKQVYGYAIWEGINKLHESDAIYTQEIAEIIGLNVAIALNNLKTN